MVGEPVQQGAGEPLGAEDRGPFVERQVAGHHDQGWQSVLVQLGVMWLESEPFPIEE